VPKIYNGYLTGILLMPGLLLGSADFARAASPPPQEVELREPYLVTLQLSISDGDPVTVTVYEGELARFEDVFRRYSVGITPLVTDVASGLVELEIRRLESGGKVLESGSPSEILSGKLGFTSVTSAIGNQPLDVRVVGIEHQPGRTSAQCLTDPGLESSTTLGCDSDVDQLVYQSDGCCVSCGEQRTCGCAVATTCGTCCNCSFC
jgi:hypothetical protein